MKKQIFKISLLIFVIFCFANTVYADTAIHLNIKTPNAIIYDENINVTPCDSDNAGTLKVTAYCAILQSGIPSVWDWSWAPGAFVTSINNIAGYTSKDTDNNDVYHYWSWSLNGIDGATGLNEYELQANDLISLIFIDPTPPPTATGSSGPLITAKENLVTPIIKSTFDSKKAFDFLIAQQKENGSFGEDLYTDWAALALASGNYQNQTIKLIKYLIETKSENRLTDYERRAMALMALGLNPYNTNNENYIEKIIKSFDEKQFGDINEDNDDIFAIIVLQNTGYKQDDKMINSDITFILSRQKENGSWDGNVDMTGAAITALFAFNQNEQVKNALSKAKEFLKQNQKDDGGFGNVSSTAWATEGILALNEKPEDWIKNENTPLDYFGSIQDTDGGIKNENIKNKIWETAYVVSVLSGKTWNQIMQKFEKPRTIELPKIPNKISKKIVKKEMITATDTVIPSVTIPKIKTQNKNWFTILLENIFDIF